RADFFWPTPPFKKEDLQKQIEFHLSDYGHSPPSELHGFTIAPGDTNTYEVPVEPASDESLKQFQGRDAHLMLFSYIQYVDVFGKKHLSWTLFAYNRDTEKLERMPAYDRMD